MPTGRSASVRVSSGVGRHADPDPRHFWGSLSTAVVRASLALALVVGLFAAVSTIGRGVPQDGPVMLGDPGNPGPGGPSAGDAMSTPDRRILGDTADDAADHTSPDPDLRPASGPGPDPRTAIARGEAATGSPNALVLAAAPAPEDTTVQVLDGVGGSSPMDDLVATLQELGYAVAATNPARTEYAVTTVFFSAGREAAAEALQAREPRIAERLPNPGLSEDVDLHVVLGADWRP